MKAQSLHISVNTTSFHKVVFFLLATLISCSLLAERNITGVITSENDGNPIPGANVRLEGTSTGVISDMNGIYQIKVPDTAAILIFSFIGYETQEIAVKESNTINLSLYEDIAELSEVVVIGYGVCKKSCTTGSTVSIRGTSSLKGTASGISSHRRLSAVREPIILEDTEVISTADESEINGASATPGGPAVAPGILTAGEINDFTKWELWKDIKSTDLKVWQNYWDIKPVQRYSVQLINTAGKPVIDASISLVTKSSAEVWTSRTDNTGKAELWANMFYSSSHSEKEFNVSISVQGRYYTIEKAKLFKNGINILQVPETCYTPNQLDAVFVVDATGSMGDEIEYLKVELNNVIDQVKEKQKDLAIRLGSVFYRDHSDEYIAKKSDLSDNINQTVDFIRAQNASGGGDTPEAVDEALEMAIEQMSWSEDARTRLLFLVLDAPPHYSKEIIKNLQQIVIKASAKGIKIIPVTGSGIDKSTEYLMRAMALATNGTYTFLTDHSGVGNPHIDPTTDKYEVEYLNQLLVRLFYQYTETPDCADVIPADSTVKIDTMEVVNSIALIDDDQQDNLSDSLLKDANDREVDNDELKSWKYYPNPTEGPINIEIEGTAGDFYLADISGKILERIDVGNKTSLSIDIRQYPSGIYFIKCQVGEKWLTGKVVLQ